MVRRLAFRESPCDLQSVDDPHRAVEPAAPRLGVGVGADEECASGVPRAAEHRADSVDSGVEPRLAHPFAEPVARLDVDGAERLADHPDAAGAELAEPPEIAEQAIRVDGDVGGARRRVHPGSCSTMFRNPLCRQGPRCQLHAAPVASFRLMSSVLRPSGARYTPEADFPLAGSLHRNRDRPRCP